MQDYTDEEVDAFVDMGKKIVKNQLILNQEFSDEICQCGHSKGYHKAHQLDNHGAGCEKCKCTIYTWSRFVKY